MEAFWGCVLLYSVRHGRHARVQKGTRRIISQEPRHHCAGVDVGAGLFLIFGTSEQAAPVIGALFTEHLKINNLEKNPTRMALTFVHEYCTRLKINKAI